MSLNKTIESFYEGILSYAGMTVEDDIIVNKDDKLGDITVDGKHLSLPRMELLRNPNGKAFFHLLNETYTLPETTTFNLYRKRLVLELNLRLSSLMVSLISLASDPHLQQRVTSGKLIEILSNLGEADHSVIEGLLTMIKSSKKVNDEGFLIDLFLKKNGEVDGVPFAAIGKVNFKLYKEINNSLTDGEKDYRVYGSKLRKKDLVIVSNVFTSIFPDIEVEADYVESTDNRIFRYLAVLLKTSYLVSERLNEIAKELISLKEPHLNAEAILGDHSWVEHMEPLCGMANEIRFIPNQTDIHVEAKRLKLDESKASNVQPQTQQPVQQPQQQTTFNPAAMTQTQQPVQQPTQPQALSPEEIIRNSMMGVQPQPNMMQPHMGMMNPQMAMMQQQQPLPSWVAAEMMRTQQQQPQQPMMNPQQLAMMQQLQQMQQMQQMQQQNMGGMGMNVGQGGLQLNPMFLQNTQSPWN